MSEISLNEIQKISKLARIRLEEHEKDHLIGQLGSIKKMIDLLKTLNTDNIIPTVSVIHQDLPLREDEVTDGNRSPDIISNSPKQEFDCFAVPKVIE
ncbi:Asp-tRNA(Asn)/Glu-tRNA(Gln) amidotransferase subunit GatC [Rickettsiales endosymbiont of Stachyamoeba lipophora]|uniref:Asp-tRNA(Asn)/Glu-tRNA(Gln) amidotransferase subunit GatC n=1 Tax=Rickettsiales endosymbiont of Stachyamoeba lipophora TaxID=2486578 RepID=UPI000F648D6D|nr:Asp-tRNA(Asn)/Glu-tRNA(Gln) amidotransferase subunit GatC [Rickettsiales endosymbiont of Stachyamoeba lipophora]AZL15025.1 Asp-tRNA(Asn)/Glu-tRNA(Gln) amidotransferase subunit GatC [Rickettsiales endosymbiont of Stachyamoeba lipophora]